MSKIFKSTLLAGGLLVVGACSRNSEPGPEAAVGAMAPAITLLDEAGEPVSLASFRGAHAVMLAFYPRDFTSG